jgi:hypothetical protein
MLPRVRKNPVRGLEKGFFPPQDPFRAPVVRSKFPPLMDLLVVRAYQWVEYQWHLSAGTPSARRREIALPEAGDPDQVRAPLDHPVGLPIRQQSETRLKIPYPPILLQQDASKYPIP